MQTNQTEGNLEAEIFQHWRSSDESNHPQHLHMTKDSHYTTYRSAQICKLKPDYQMCKLLHKTSWNSQFRKYNEHKRKRILVINVISTTTHQYCCYGSYYYYYLELCKLSFLLLKYSGKLLIKYSSTRLIPEATNYRSKTNGTWFLFKFVVLHEHKIKCYCVQCSRILPISFFHISQGSAATHLRCGGQCGMGCVANLTGNTTVKKYWKLANICQSYEWMYSGTGFFWLKKVLL